MSKFNEKGFSVVELLIVILVLVLIGGVGYLVYKDHKTTVPKVVTVTKTVVLQPKTQSTNTTTTSTPSYMVIKEWGVKIPLTSSISDAYYYYNNGYAYLSVQSHSSDQCAANNVSEGVITRFSPTDIDPQTNQTLLSEHTIDAVKVGNYYYFYTHPQAACSSDTTIQNQANTDMQAFEQAVKQIQAE
ncbi:MAG TPA: hypothetical protein VIH90_02570 [Candidatus Saccharimonadales bacterium]